ncbi:hypothetical protein PBR31_00024 [Xanthomonas phage PBR31]|uniref:Uncharacterized protein n=1 Tax=Xanthomonas phage PPDBI TaxID=2723911 RepID=A0A6H0X5Y5_9CAUD|nr:hypothetical protein [Ralstonia pickettii]NYS10333.1 hypothetical protein [Ralstonia pickettii]QIN95335.1 hypothetical protein PBR31_00024 [Xanthomonas phage PBR31]QIW89383.1 hypothetical protein PPDBI_00024 [Xanthomonas phage PPDBI]
MEFPKMLYRSVGSFSDQKAIEDGLVSRAIETKIVQSPEEEAAASDWTEDIASFIGKRRAAKADTADAQPKEGGAS